MAASLRIVGHLYTCWSGGSPTLKPLYLPHARAKRCLMPRGCWSPVVLIRQHGCGLPKKKRDPYHLSTHIFIVCERAAPAIPTTGVIIILFLQFVDLFFFVHSPRELWERPPAKCACGVYYAVLGLGVFWCPLPIGAARASATEESHAAQMYNQRGFQKG